MDHDQVDRSGKFLNGSSDVTADSGPGPEFGISSPTGKIRGCCLGRLNCFFCCDPHGILSLIYIDKNEGGFQLGRSVNLGSGPFISGQNITQFRVFFILVPVHHGFDALGELGKVDLALEEQLDRFFISSI